MAFTKVADCKPIAYWEVMGDNTLKIIKNAAAASPSHIPSFYINPGSVGKLDIKSALTRVASVYDVSADPTDYIYEAVRAVTTGIPNENGDAFHRDELLRFDHRLGCTVYQTFILKPHLVNHRANNPKTARGVILDAHYNDDSPVLDVCPKCQSRTASTEARDVTGLYCRKCGQCVKDEFTEILIAIDQKKDPTFANGVRNGVLNATSMGCICESTTCNVCNHVAYNKDEFCFHIRGGNKKRWFKTASGERQAFEWCNNVIFTEDSRVDQPADPKALQREILQATQRRDMEMGKAAALRDETTILELTKQLRDLEVRLAQIEPQAPKTPKAPPGPHPTTIEQYHDKSKGVGQPVEQKGLAAMGIETDDSGDIDAGPRIQESITASVCSDLDESLFSEDHAVDKIASKGTEPMAQSVYSFKNAYNDIRAQVTEQGNVRVANRHGTLFVVEAPEPLNTAEARTEFGTEVLRHIAQYGIVRTMNAFDARQSPKIANVLEKGVYDFKGGRSKGDTKPSYKDEKHDYKGDDGKHDPEKAINADGEVDRASKPPPHDTKDSITTEHAEDFKDGRGEKKKTTQTPNDAPQKEKTKPVKLNQSVLDGNVTDHTIKLTGKKNGQAKVAEASTSKPSKPSSSKPSAPSKSAASTSKASSHSKPSAISKPSSSKPSSHTAASKPSAPSKSGPSSSKPSSSKSAAGEGIDAPPAAAAPAPAAPPGDMGGGSLPSLMQALTAADMLLQKLLSSGPSPEMQQMIGEAGQKLTEVTQKAYAATTGGGLPGAAAPGIDTGTADLVGAVGAADEMSPGVDAGAPVPPPDAGVPVTAQMDTAGASDATPALRDMMAALDTIAQALDAAGDPALERPVGVRASKSTSKNPPKVSKPSTSKASTKSTSRSTSSKPFDPKKSKGTEIHWSKGERPWDKRSKKAAMSKTCTSKCPPDCSKHKKAAKVASAEETRQYESRLERLYKRRLTQVASERDEKVAKVTDVVAEKFKRALKLAASRQRLNLEESPLKIAFADVLLNPMDLPNDEYFPGVDIPLAQTIIERAAADGFDPFVDRIIERAAELMKVSDETFATLEADVNNLQPVLPAAPDAGLSQSNRELRRAASEGNMHLAPRASDDSARVERMDRSAVRTALNNTKIHRSHAPFNNGAGA